MSTILKSELSTDNDGKEKDNVINISSMSKEDEEEDIERVSTGGTTDVVVHPAVVNTNTDNNDRCDPNNVPNSSTISSINNDDKKIEQENNKNQQQQQQSNLEDDETSNNVTNSLHNKNDDDDVNNIDTNELSMIDNNMSIIVNDSYLDDDDDDDENNNNDNKKPDNNKKPNDFAVDDNDNVTIASSSNSQNDIDDQMPLFHYSRLYGSIPRTTTLSSSSNNNSTGNSNILESPCTCSTMGKVRLTSDTTVIPTTTTINDIPVTTTPILQTENSIIASAIAATTVTSTTSTTTIPNGSTSSSTSANNIGTSTGSGTTNEQHDENEEDEEDDVYSNNNNILANDDQTLLYMNETVSLLGMGLQDGHVLVLDAQTGMSVLNSNTNSSTPTSTSSVINTNSTNSNTYTTTGNTSTTTKPYFRIRENQTTVNVPISSVSFDSSGTSFGAIDNGGMCCIWTFKYKVQMRKHQYEYNSTTTTNTGLNSQSSSSATAAATVPAGLVEANDTTTVSTATTTTTNPTKQQQTTGNVFSNMVSSAFNWSGTKQTQQSSATDSATATTTTTTTTTGVSADTTTTQQTATVPTTGTTTTTTRYKYVPTLTIGEMKTNRINYPKSFGIPTCLVLDPAYTYNKNRTDTSLIVAFDDGKIVYSKRGWGLLQRRDDKFIQYTTSPTIHDKEFNGIESIVWRGSIIAFADCTGIRLYDIELFQPIAHIDRPTGARPALYPNIKVKPNLCFESSSSLLVAWGDCLLAIRIHESNTNNNNRQSNNDTSDNVASNPPALQDRTAAATTTTTTTTTRSLADSTGNNNSSHSIVTKKRVVECCMAWALDCVACGVVPLDENHLIILGQVIPDDDDDDDDQSDDFNGDDLSVEEKDETGESYSLVRRSDVKHEYRLKNEIELQVISRLNGSIIYSDILPLLNRQQPTHTISSNNKAMTFVLESYSMLSSFAVPRMENSLELLDELKVSETYRNDTLQMPSSSSSLYGRNYLPYNSNNNTKSSPYFKDSHIRWNLRMVAYDHNDETKTTIDTIPVLRNHDDSKEPDNDDDNDLSDDDFGFIFRPINSLGNSIANGNLTNIGNTSTATSPQQPSPPLLVIMSSADAVVARTRDIDDAISYTIQQRRKPATALRMAIQNMTSLRRHTINELVNYYFRALLRLNTDVVTQGSTIDSSKKIDTTTALDVLETVAKPDDDSRRKTLSLRRMKLAAEAMPILLGTNINMWEYWISELERAPGALFVVRNHLPVRDPKLPEHVYENILSKMLEQVEAILHGEGNDGKVEQYDEHTATQAENQFLDTLLAWGPTQTLFEYVKLFECQANHDPSISIRIKSIEGSIVRRNQQSAATYLQFPSNSVTAETPLSAIESGTNIETGHKQALFSIDRMMRVMSSRVSTTNMSDIVTTIQTNMNDKVALHAMAKLCIMNGQFDDALNHFFAISDHYPTITISQIEQAAYDNVNTVEDADGKSLQTVSKYCYLLPFIENHHLYQNLLDKVNSNGSNKQSKLPLISLLTLVGLDMVGDFLIEHCVPPQTPHNVTTRNNTGRQSVVSDGNTNERRGTLPIDLVAEQFSTKPKLLLWYLHMVFLRKPEVYVKFPNTTNPPVSIIMLHKKQLDLYMKFANTNKDSANVLEKVEPFRVLEKSTPLLSFLKIVLPLGSIEPVEVGRLLQSERRGGDTNSHVFALELAFVLEHFSDNQQSDAKAILELYLHGTQSIMLAVSYAQRNVAHSEMLWEVVIDHCLSPPTKTVDDDIDDGTTPTESFDGTLFGQLLEAAALSGADLAKIVRRIPTGMQVVGLKPRLVAAVADYRLKVQMHKSSSLIGAKEKLILQREVTQRSRRGVRHHLIQSEVGPIQPLSNPVSDYSEEQEEQQYPNTKIFLPFHRPKIRQEHTVLNFSLPIR